jgi:DnaK suppressor protein
MQTINDETLRFIRQGLLARDAELHDRVRRVQDDLHRHVTPRTADAPDAAVVVENDEILQAVEEFARGEIRQIGRALERLEAGTYGICDGCGQHIDVERLRVVPYALHCRNCAPD